MDLHATSREGSGKPDAAGVSVREDEILRQLIDAAPDSMVVANEAGTIVFVNRQALQMFGYTRDELLSQMVEALVPKRLRDRHIAHRADYAAHPRIRRMGQGLDLFALRKDGLEFPVEIMLSPIKVDGELFVCAAIRDVTDRKLIEAELHSQRLSALRLLEQRTRELSDTSEQLHAVENMALIGTVAASLVHDLNNLLMPVRNRIDLLRSEQHSSAAEHIEAMQRAVDYLGEQCKRLRSLTSTGADPADDETATDLQRWWSEVSALVRSVLPANVQLNADVPDDLPKVALPPLQLTQVIFNLANNAARAMQHRPRGRLHISVSTLEDKPAVRLAVADDGEGMAPDVLKRCLDPNFTTHREAGGTGMGLSVVKSIISRVSGRIEVQSEPGRGTTFHLVLPTADR